MEQKRSQILLISQPESNLLPQIDITASISPMIALVFQLLIASLSEETPETPRSHTHCTKEVSKTCMLTVHLEETSSTYFVKFYFNLLESYVFCSSCIWCKNLHRKPFCCSRISGFPNSAGFW